MGRGSKRTKSEKAKPPVAHKPLKNNSGRRRDRDLEKRLAEAQEQQLATAESLRVIWSSPTAARPVLDAIARSAARLCEANDANVWLQDDEALVVRAHHGPIPSPRQRNPIGRDWVSGRAVVDGRSIHVDDLATAGDEFPAGQAMALRDGHRTTLATPLLREGKAIGAILIRRTEVRPFSDKHIALLQTFADQAVIAVENVRLFTELQARNNDLTATGEILRVIASSPTDLQPAFNVIASRALRLCDGIASLVFRYDGTLIPLAASDSAEGIDLQAIRDNFPAPPDHATFASRVVTVARPLYIADIEHDPDAPSGLVEFGRANGFRSIFAAPMRRDEHTIGVIAVTHRNVGGFTPEQGALLQTFADQAVIAIENVRLFKELETRNRDLSEALDQQTAMSEILRVIAGSPTDAQPVFDAILRNAVHLCNAKQALVYQLVAGRVHLVGHQGFEGDEIERFGRTFPRSVEDPTPVPTTIRSATMFHAPDVEASPEGMYSQAARTAMRPYGIRSHLIVPLLRNQEAIGAIVVHHPAVNALTDGHTELLKTFADQAVIAIENVRLFKELEAKNTDLTEALARQTTTSEVLKVISRSTFDLQPVLDTLVESATRLCAASTGLIWRFDGEVFRLKANYGLSAEAKEFWERNPHHPGRGSLPGRAALERRPIHIPDVLADREYQAAEGQRIGRYRSLL